MAREWTSFELPDLPPRSYPLLATVSKSSILLLGGRSANSFFSDGIIFDAETKNVTSRFDSGELKICCRDNQVAVTQYGKLVAMVTGKGSKFLIEIAKDGSEVNSIKDLRDLEK